ncbi:right-handed parallel beta-helix repeat-containing protein [Microbulbifer sp. 2201CG32-9]|uniref:right-handed parallel beta-helix repeat-containing protein n=1 Tax=Microbulbifer sp. 2201CG32-9 TaxID=3232309 RepID=UPI00345B8FE0
MGFRILLLVTLLVGCSKGPIENGNNPAISGEIVTIRVSPNYDNSSDADSLEGALSKARKLLAGGRGVSIELVSGTYYLKNTIRLGPEFSGSNSFPFTIKAEDDGKAVLSGGERLNLKWEPFNNHLLKAKISTRPFDQLYINGKKQVRARYPNFNDSVSVFNGYAEDAISPERVKTWKNPVGGYVHALHEGRWGGMHYEIVGVKENEELELRGGFQNNRHSQMHPKYRFVENIFEELDAPGEWFYDHQEGVLYYYPADNVDINSATVEVPRLDRLLELSGSEEKPVKNIVIQGLEFVHTNYTFMQTKEPLLRSDWTIYRGAAVTLEGTENCEVKENRFHDLGGNAIFVSNYNRNAIISTNEIFDIGASAISFVGDADAVRSPSFEYNEYVSYKEMDLEPGPKSDNYPALSTVTDNLIHDIGKVEKQVAGVQLSMSSEITVSHNSIYHVPRAGINVSEGTWGGHIIEYNDVFDTVLETSDHGAFNSWGRDRFWHPDRQEMNRLARMHPGLYKLDALKPIIIRNNRFQCDHGWDIDLDDGSSNYRIYNNVALSGGIKLREGFDRVVENNVVINNAIHPHVWFEKSGDVVKRNILFSAHKPILNDYWGDEVDKNFFTNKDDLSSSQAFGTDSLSMFGEVDFIDPGHGDYTVSSTSGALDIGYENFPMDNFGVKSPRLKAKARVPEFPKIFDRGDAFDGHGTLEVLGATFKSVTTLGEQSALGLPDIAGAFVVNIEQDSKFAQAGLRKGDVILRVFDSEFGGSDQVKGVSDFLSSYKARKWRGFIEVVIFRNQNEQELKINLLD